MVAKPNQLLCIQYRFTFNLFLTNYNQEIMRGEQVKFTFKLSDDLKDAKITLPKDGKIPVNVVFNKEKVIDIDGIRVENGIVELEVGKDSPVNFAVGGIIESKTGNKIEQFKLTEVSLIPKVFKK